MKRFGQVVLLAGLAVVATSSRVLADEQVCRDLCYWSWGYCSAEGGVWTQSCADTGAYYDSENDICDLDSYCDYEPPPM